MGEESGMVTLKDFVRDALTDVIEGVREAQDQVQEITGPKGHGAQISPPLFLAGTSQNPHYAPSEIYSSRSGGRNFRVEYFEFDVAVTVGQREGQKVGVGVILAGVMGAGGRSVVLMHATGLVHVPGAERFGSPEGMTTAVGVGWAVLVFIVALFWHAFLGLCFRPGQLKKKEQEGQ